MSEAGFLHWSNQISSSSVVAVCKPDLVKRICFRLLLWTCVVFCVCAWAWASLSIQLVIGSKWNTTCWPGRLELCFHQGSLFWTRWLTYNKQSGVRKPSCPLLANTLFSLFFLSSCIDLFPHPTPNSTQHKAG